MKSVPQFWATFDKYLFENKIKFSGVLGVMFLTLAPSSQN